MNFAPRVVATHWLRPPEAIIDRVKLTPYELKMCTALGQERWQWARDHKCDPGLGTTRYSTDASNDIRGCKCEYAASIMVNRSWRPRVGERGFIDVGDMYEARSGTEHWHRLIIKPKDIVDEGTGLKLPNRPFLLVITKDEPWFYCPGWFWSDDAPLFPLTTNFGDACYFIPQDRLHGLDTLPGA